MPYKAQYVNRGNELFSAGKEEGGKEGGGRGGSTPSISILVFPLFLSAGGVCGRAVMHDFVHEMMTGDG